MFDFFVIRMERQQPRDDRDSGEPPYKRPRDDDRFVPSPSGSGDALDFSSTEATANNSSDFEGRLAELEADEAQEAAAQQQQRQRRNVPGGQDEVGIQVAEEEMLEANQQQQAGTSHPAPDQEPQAESDEESDEGEPNVDHLKFLFYPAPAPRKPGE